MSPKVINFHIVAPDGSITGYTPSGILQQIPYMGEYSTTGVDYEYDLKNPMLEWHQIESKGNANIPVGKYKMVIYGTNDSMQAKIGFGIRWTESMKWHIDSIVGEYMLPNMVWTYEFEVPASPTPDSQIVFNKIATPKDLITDINALFAEGYIGNTEFVTEVIKKINTIEEKRLKSPEKDDEKATPAQKAKKEYQELLEELNEKNIKPEKDEYVHTLAMWILRRDLEYIINHL